MSNSPKSCLWALKPGAENIAEQARTCPGRPVVKTFLRLFGHKDKENDMSRLARRLPISFPSDLSKMLSACTVCWCLNGPIMWNRANSSPSPRPFSIKTPSFQASWSNPLSSAWDTFRPGALPLNYLVYLHQEDLFVILWMHTESGIEWEFPH